MFNCTRGCNQQNSECGKLEKTEDPVSSTNDLQIKKKREREKNMEWGICQFQKTFLLRSTYVFYGKSQYNFSDI